MISPGTWVGSPNHLCRAKPPSGRDQRPLSRRAVVPGGRDLQERLVLDDTRAHVIQYFDPARTQRGPHEDGTLPGPYRCLSNPTTSTSTATELRKLMK